MTTKKTSSSNSSGHSQVTTDHEEIRQWAEKRGGKPAHVKGTGDDEDIGMIRIDFPGFSGQQSLEAISWEEFFEKFEENNLALVYQEETSAGQQSNFNKIIKRQSDQKKTHDKSHTPLNL
jgi:hypothetical protein